jgi:hypothetical protein
MSCGWSPAQATACDGRSRTFRTAFGSADAEADAAAAKRTPLGIVARSESALADSDLAPNILGAVDQEAYPYVNG